jgi:putative ABC transport system permease protein
MHSFRENLRIAWRNLLVNKTRSILTLLGMVIGVAAVISIVSLGEGLKLMFAGEVGKLGSDFIQIVPKSLMREGGGDDFEGRVDNFNLADVDALKRNTTLLQGVVAGMRTTGLVKRGDKSYIAMIEGGEPEFIDIASIELASGDNLTEKHLRARSRVAIIGDNVKEKLFADIENPLGQIIKVREENFTVIGVMEHKGGFAGGPSEDDFVVVPLTTMQDRILGSDEVLYIIARVTDTTKMDEAKDEIRHILRQRRHLMIAIFGIIAAFSLLIGGIGVLSIMLVTVTERTSEIGLRMAIGAAPRTVLGQFLMEAMLLTAVGGTIGLLLGWLGALGLSALITSLISVEWTPAVPVHIAVITLLCSALFGVVFGIIPAYIASRKDPVESLRYE